MPGLSHSREPTPLPAMFPAWRERARFPSTGTGVRAVAAGPSLLFHRRCRNPCCLRRETSRHRAGASGVRKPIPPPSSRPPPSRAGALGLVRMCSDPSLQTSLNPPARHRLARPLTHTVIMSMLYATQRPWFPVISAKQIGANSLIGQLDIGGRQMAGQSLELAPPAPHRYTARFNVSYRDKNTRGQLARPRHLSRAISSCTCRTRSAGRVACA
jgi:hypothetical protein